MGAISIANCSKGRQAKCHSTTRFKWISKLIYVGLLAVPLAWLWLWGRLRENFPTILPWWWSCGGRSVGGIPLWTSSYIFPYSFKNSYLQSSWLCSFGGLMLWRTKSGCLWLLCQWQCMWPAAYALVSDWCCGSFTSRADILLRMRRVSFSGNSGEIPLRMCGCCKVDDAPLVGSCTLGLAGFGVWLSHL